MFLPSISLLVRMLLCIVYFYLVEIIFPKKFSAQSPEGSHLKKIGLFFRQQIYLTTKALLKKLGTH
jgi:hypothetical protein